MSQGDASAGSTAGPATGELEDRGGTEGGAVSTVTTYARRAVRSGAVAGLVGGAALFRGVRALRRGQRGRAVAHLLLGGVLVAVAVAQRRGGGDGAGVDQRDVVSTAPDVEDVAGGAGAERRGPEHASGDEAADVVDSGPDVADVEPRREPDRDAETGDVDQSDVAGTDVEASASSEANVGDETRPASEASAGGEAGTGGEVGTDASAEAEGSAAPAAESYDRLGEAAFDAHGMAVPVPQRAFNLRLLSLDSEVFWGIREADDAVVVAGEFDPIQDRDGVRYVASTEVDDERTLTVPDAVTDHWDDVAGGGTAVAGGDDLVFATTEAMQEDDQLLVVPAAWADDVLDEE